MKSKKSLLIVSALAIVAFFSAFVSPAGGEGFEIYVDNKLCIQKFNTDMKQVTNLQLNASNANSELKVRFYHCGLTGKNRSLSLKNAQNQLLKQWQFNNSDVKNFAVTVPVKEILALQQKAGNATLYLYYSSKEASAGRLLTGIVRKDRVSPAAK
ncbi:MAG: hypothetical protein H7Y86_13865 [Rhizobacter sp.]|nr:hypothetical protein [Ferruginibacter sp.]